MQINLFFIYFFIYQKLLIEIKKFHAIDIDFKLIFKVHDLLDPQTHKQSLKVREHNVLGPYVDGLSQLAVTSFQVSSNCSNVNYFLCPRIF